MRPQVLQAAQKTTTTSTLGVINNKARAYRHVSEPFGAACPEFAFAYDLLLPA
jgi:hypothetical protein